LQNGPKPGGLACIDSYGAAFRLSGHPGLHNRDKWCFVQDSKPEPEGFAPCHVGKGRGADKAKVKPSASVDFRKWCSPVEDQESLGSCTAHAGVGLMEYHERKAFGKHIDASRLFLYKTTRNLIQMKRDTEAYLRSTMQAMVLFGVPLEEYWPYDIKKFDKEASAFCNSFAQNYQTLQCIRLDPKGITKDLVLKQINGNLTAKILDVRIHSVIPSPRQTMTARFPSPALRKTWQGVMRLWPWAMMMR